MQKDADNFQPSINSRFIVKALEAECRVDGRGLFEGRSPTFAFSADDTSCTVSFGDTRVLAVVAAELEVPRGGRNEGRLTFNVDFSPMASLAFETGRMGREATQISNLVERSLKDSAAVDLEALSVLTGRKAWLLRVDVRVLNHAGNLPDICVLAAISALRAFRLPQVEVTPEGAVTVFPVEEREPHALTIQHIPFAVTFALFQAGHTLVVDPTLAEEGAALGSVTAVANAHDELCGVHKADGIGLTGSQLMRCVRVALARARDLGDALHAALEVHKLARVHFRVRRVGGTAATGSTAKGAAAAAPPCTAVAALDVGGEPLTALPPLEALQVTSASVDAPDDEAAAATPADAASAEATPAPAPRAVLQPGGGAKKKKKRKKAPEAAEDEVGAAARGPRRPGVPDHAVDAAPDYDAFGAISALIAGSAGAPVDAAPAGLAASVKPRSKRATRH